jgi:hypothetical protein
MEKNKIQHLNITTDKLFDDIRNIIEQGRRQAYAATNQIVLLTYWHIGRRIVEEEQHGKARAQYGTRLIKTLAEQLVPKYGATFCKRNLDYFRQFYLCFNDLERLYRLQTLRPESVVCKRGIGTDVECEDTQSQYRHAILWSPYGLCKGGISIACTGHRI